EQYLEIERKAERRSEYFNGEMFAMAGAREAHVIVVTNISGELRQQFRNRPCRVYSTDMRVRSEEHTSELQSRVDVVCRILLEKKKKLVAEEMRSTPNETDGKPL